MRVVFVSTYELGHQPLHLAAPAASALDSGHQVRCLDLSVEAFGPQAEDDFAWAQAVAISVPMHTAMRLAVPLCRMLRERWPQTSICLYGLYSPLAAEAGLAGLADEIIAGEYSDRLVAWLGRSVRSPRSNGATEVHVELRRGELTAKPARHLLPPLSTYARLLHRGEERLVGYVESTHGCSHRCRHCPVPVVYDGRFRLVPTENLLADVEQLVELGATHITFGDPDFLNGPLHARRVIAEVHGAFPELTFDCTVKVSHILAHPDIWPEMAGAGCIFVVSAFESTNDDLLARLDKGHTVADSRLAVALLRDAGIALQPTWMAFTPWTKPQDLADLVDFVAAEGLVETVDLVQYGLRLLVPPGSLLLDMADVPAMLDRYDPEALTWTWRSPYPGMDALQKELSALAERAQADRASPADSWAELCSLVGSATGRPDVGKVISRLAAQAPPRLSEAWFCCAEPTSSQLDLLGAAAQE